MFLAGGAHGGGWSQEQPNFRPPLHLSHRHPICQPWLHSLVEGRRGKGGAGGPNSRQPSPLFSLPFPPQPSSSVLTAVSAAVSVSRAGLEARVLQGVCRSFRKNETQGGVVSVDPRPQSSWESQTEGASSKAWIPGPGDTGPESKRMLIC